MNSLKPATVSEKAALLSLQPYCGYAVNIGAACSAWFQPQAEAIESAKRLKVLAEEVFPGLIATITNEANVYPVYGPDAKVMEEMDEWLCKHVLSIALHVGPV